MSRILRLLAPVLLVLYGSLAVADDPHVVFPDDAPPDGTVELTDATAFPDDVVFTEEQPPSEIFQFGPPMPPESYEQVTSDCCQPPLWPEDRYGQSGCCGPCCEEAVWYLRGELLWLTRSKSGNRSLSINDRPASMNPDNRFVLETDDLDFDFKPGLRFTLGRLINPTTSVEGVYFGQHNWNASEQTGIFIDPLNPGLGALDPYWGDSTEFFDLTEFEQATRHIVSYTSEIENVELGMRHWLAPNASVLLGLRYFNLDEDFLFFSIDDPDLNLNDIAFYATHTDNDLVGVQVGGEISRPLILPSACLELTGKGGLFVNFAEQENILFNAGPILYDERDQSGSRLSSVLELGASVAVQVTNRLAVRAGYTVMFISGVALAPDQLDDSPHRANSREFLSDSSSLLLHGAFIGGEYTWN